MLPDWKFIKTLKSLTVVVATILLCSMGMSQFSLAEDQIRHARIISGETVTKSVPQVAMLLYIDSNGRQYIGCGGTLVGPQKILTAAHCVDDRTPFAVALDRRTFASAEGVQIGVDYITIHPRFNLNTLENDLAIVTLNQPAPFEPMQLIDAAAGESLQSGQEFNVYGWGYTSPDFTRPSDTLRAAQVRYIPTNTCNGPTSYRGLVGQTMMCAGHMEGGADSCGGDSGGPLVLESENGPRIAGLVSWGAASLCGAANKPGVYTRVSSFLGWINVQINTRANSSEFRELIARTKKRDHVIGFTADDANHQVMLVRRGKRIFRIEGTSRVPALKIRRRSGALLHSDSNGDGDVELVHALNKKVFEYTLFGNRYKLTKITRLPVNLRTAVSVQGGDIDGDGKADLVALLKNGQVVVLRRTEAGYSLLYKKKTRGKALMVGSLSANSPAEVFIKVGKVFLRVPFGISISAATSFKASGTSFLQDVDGDGLSELVSLIQRRKKIELLLATQKPGGFLPQRNWITTERQKA